MMHRKMFKDFMLLKEGANDWKSETKGKDLIKGFKPPTNLKPIVRAFKESGKITLQHDTVKPVMMPAKELYLVGGPVRDFVSNKSIKDLDLATPATPSQIALILSAAGFKRAGDRSGKGGSELHVPERFWDINGEAKKIQDAGSDDKMVWYIKGRDASKEKKPFVIGAVVNGEEFDIATFRRDAKTENGQSEVDFTDNPKEDAERRDLTINSLYIRLDNPDGENKALFDPTGHGQYDLENGQVRTVGKAEDRFQEDPLRVMRSIRFHCKFGKSDKLDPDIQKAIPKFLNLEERIAPDRMRGEFVKGIMDPDVDLKKYFGIYYNTKLLSTVFPGVRFESPNGMPPTFTDKKDKVLAIAWLLQHNPLEKIDSALGVKRMVNGERKDSGWQTEERNAVLYLIKLKEFTPEKVYHYMKGRAGTGLTNRQIKDWVEMFHPDGQDSTWGKRVKTFADHTPSVSWDHVVQAGKDVCPNCRGNGENCARCGGSGKLPMDMRGKAVADMEHNNFRDKLGEKK